MAKRCFIFDIDGTLADCMYRLHHIQKEPKDWRAFFAACGNDPIIDHMVLLAVSILDAGQSIVFVSGRSDECRDATIEWLMINLIFESTAAVKLYMRKEGDHRPDEIVKLELLAQLRADGWEPIMVFEDRSRVVKMWREAGIPCAQVSEGDF